MRRNKQWVAQYYGEAHLNSIKYNSKDCEEWEQTKSLTDSLDQLNKHTGNDLEITDSAMEQEVELDNLTECLSSLFFCMPLKMCVTL